MASTLTSGHSSLAKRLTSVRYLPTRLCRSARETASSMGNAPFDSLHKFSRLTQSTCSLSNAEMMIAVVGSMAQLLNNKEVTGKYRSKLFSPSRELIGKHSMQAGMAPLWPHESCGF